MKTKKKTAKSRSKSKTIEDLYPRANPKGGLNFAADGSVRPGDAASDVFLKIAIDPSYKILPTVQKKI
jgi:hypothetical protein